MKAFKNISLKIISRAAIAQKVARWKKEGKKIVFSNGCFDILHRGHIEYLAKASSLGDILIIGLNADISVKRIKGQTRPINDEQARAILMAALSFVDAVVLFEEDTPYNLINLIRPDFLVKGKDYKAKDVVGYDILREYGGRVKTIKLVDGYSTSDIEKKIIMLHNGKTN